MSSRRRFLRRGRTEPFPGDAGDAIRHRLHARCVILEGESCEAFQVTLANYVERLLPADEVEMALVEGMAAASWRFRRSWALETRLHMRCQRALYSLLLLRQTRIPNEPNPNSEHLYAELTPAANHLLGAAAPGADPLDPVDGVIESRPLP